MPDIEDFPNITDSAGNTIEPRTLKITSLVQINEHITHNLNRFVSERGGQRWQIEVEYPPLTRAQFGNAWAFLVARRGKFKRFNFTIPGHQSRGTYGDGTDAKYNSANVKSGGTGNTVVIQGFGAAANGETVFMPGDFIRFSSHPKVYMITNAPVVASQEATLEIEPSLVKPAQISGGTSNIDCTGLFAVSLTENELETEYDLNKTYTLKLKLVETIT